jgi:hypothetical protein
MGFSAVGFFSPSGGGGGAGVLTSSAMLGSFGQSRRAIRKLPLLTSGRLTVNDGHHKNALTAKFLREIRYRRAD